MNEKKEILWLHLCERCDLYSNVPKPHAPIPMCTECLRKANKATSKERLRCRRERDLAEQKCYKARCETFNKAERIRAQKRKNDLQKRQKVWEKELTAGNEN